MLNAYVFIEPTDAVALEFTDFTLKASLSIMYSALVMAQMAQAFERLRTLGAFELGWLM